MKIMLIEDDNTKARTINGYLNKQGVPDNRIIRVKTMSEFTAEFSDDIGLFIIDLNLPSIEKGVATQNGKTILESIIKAGRGDALLLAISSYPQDFPELRSHFEAHGCILADFQNKRGWQSTLDHLLIQLNKNTRFDFLVFCALPEERNPYIVLLEGKQSSRSDIDCFDTEINGHKGSIILLPRMGLVDAAIIAGQCIDRFKPRIVGMSGICGGFPDRAQYGQLIFSSMAYEYQSGKWASDGFSQEPYQVPTEHIALTQLKRIASQPGLIDELESGFRGKRPSESFDPAPGIFTSGSAVIADQKFLEQIKIIHRKVAALDMEVFAIQRAAEISPHKPICICAKTVVDLCDKNKGDDIHLYGSYVSAKFLIKSIKELLTKNK